MPPNPNRQQRGDTRQLQFIDIDDFTPGCYDASPNAVSTPSSTPGPFPAPLGAADASQTYQCIALRNGGIGPLPGNTSSTRSPISGSPPSLLVVNPPTSSGSSIPGSPTMMSLSSVSNTSQRVRTMPRPGRVFSSVHQAMSSKDQLLRCRLVESPVTPIHSPPESLHLLPLQQSGRCASSSPVMSMDR